MKKPRIIYFFDPLCITCFSFSPVLKLIREHYGSKIKFDLVPSGMVTGNRVGPVSQKADYLKKKVAAIENTTETRFGKAFLKLLDKGSYISDSTPPSLAWNVLKSFRPDLKFELGYDIQASLFLKGMDLNMMRPYFDICEKYEINKRGFLERYRDPAFLKITTDLFDYANNENVEQFPSLMLETKDGLYPFVIGYTNLDELDTEIKNLLESTGKRA